MIDKMISELSCNKEKFDKAKGIYEKAINESKFRVALNFNEEQSERKNRNRKITWFNLPYGERVETSIGRQLLKLIRKHFPKHHKFSKIFNSNSIKLSYGCTRTKNLTKQYNSKILNEAPT